MSRWTTNQSNDEKRISRWKSRKIREGLVPEKTSAVLTFIPPDHWVSCFEINSTSSQIYIEQDKPYSKHVFKLEKQILEFSQNVGILYVKRGSRYGHATAFFVAPNIVQSTAHEIQSTDELIFVIHDRIGITFAEMARNAWNVKLIYMDPLIDFAFFELKDVRSYTSQNFLLPAIYFPIEGELCISVIFNGSVDNEWLRTMHKQLPTQIRHQTNTTNHRARCK